MNCCINRSIHITTSSKNPTLLHPRLWQASKKIAPTKAHVLAGAHAARWTNLRSMASLQSNVSRFIELLSSGQSERAMQEFYHDEILIFENRLLARAGKRLCLDYERQQLSAQAVAPQFKIVAHAINESTGHAFIEYNVRFGDSNGRPMRLEEVTVQTWEGDKIVQERFYYEGVVDEGDLTEDVQ
jgi:hypothetical protein